jgi:hypothetical protein
VFLAFRDEIARLIDAGVLKKAPHWHLTCLSTHDSIDARLIGLQNFAPGVLS